VNTPASRMIILGAAGRDFHTFNECYPDDRGLAALLDVGKPVGRARYEFADVDAFVTRAVGSAPS
jgi:hypothetical protein